MAQFDLSAMDSLNKDHLAQFKPDAMGGLSRDHIANIRPEAIGGLNKDHVVNMAPEAMGGLNKDQVANMTPEAMSGLNRDHVTNMPPEAMGGLNKDLIANMPPESMGGLNKDHVANMPPESMVGLDKDHVANMPPESMGGLDKDRVGKMPPESMGGLDKDHIANMPPESMGGLTKDHLANMPPESAAGLTGAHVANTPPEALEGLTIEHLQHSPTEAASGVTPEHIAVAPSEFFGGLTMEHLAYFDRDKMQEAADYDKARVFANLNPENMDIETLMPMLPENITMEEDGTMKMPPGLLIALPFKTRGNALPERLKIPEISDLNKGFGLGGVAPKTALQELEEGLAAAQLSEFALSQDNNGILNVEGSGNYAGTHLTFIPDNRGMKQGAKGTPAGLTLSDDGKYMVVTPNEREIPVIPAPKNPEGVLNVLPDNSEVELGENGNVTINTGDEMLSAIFDPVVQSGGDQPRGFHRMNKTHGVLVYEDGTFQNVNAAFHSSDEFLEAAENFEGVIEVKSNRMNGTVKVKLGDASFHLKPWFEVGKAEQAGPKIEFTEENAENEGIELVFTDKNGNAQIFSAIKNGNAQIFSAIPE